MQECVHLQWMLQIPIREVICWVITADWKTYRCRCYISIERSKCDNNRHIIWVEEENNRATTLPAWSRLIYQSTWTHTFLYYHNKFCLLNSPIESPYPNYSGKTHSLGCFGIKFVVAISHGTMTKLCDKLTTIIRKIRLTSFYMNSDVNANSRQNQAWIRWI